MTPVVAVISELKNIDQNVEIRFWCDQSFAAQAKQIMAVSHQEVRVETIIAGKLRRYHSLSKWRQLLRFRTIVLPNIIDGIKITVGMFQSFIKLLIWRPQVVFTKGGFVCLPIGFAAHLLKIPLVIHDSDAHPGLTNRIMAKWATSIATGAPLSYYSYPSDKSHYTGIPVRDSFRPVSPEAQADHKRQLGFDATLPLVVVTGGGLGAERINQAVLASRNQLEATTQTILICGKSQYDKLRKQTGDDSSQFIMKPFISEHLEYYLQAADVVVSRAGMTSMMEIAACAKPAIIIPNAYLTGGHQLKNAAVFTDQDAVEVVSEDSIVEHPEELLEVIRKLLASSLRRAELARNIAVFAQRTAAKDVAQLISNAATHLRQ